MPAPGFQPLGESARQPVAVNVVSHRRKQGGRTLRDGSIDPGQSIPCDSVVSDGRHTCLAPPDGVAKRSVRVPQL